MYQPIKHLLEFGPFRIDPEQRVLLRDQQPVPLSPKAFELLLVLTQHGGKVVLKDDLMKTLWPDTFVEESNLGQHVFQLRKALGERPQDHTYIVTVPGRGYRFAQTVRKVTEGEPEEDGPQKDEEQIVMATRSLARVVIERDRKKDLRLWLAIGAMFAATLVAVGLYWRTQQKPKLTEKDTIVLADFDNKTGDPVFDGTLRQGLSAQLEQSPFLNLLSDQRTRQTLALMTLPRDSKLTPETAREICQRTASAAALDGSIAQIGTRYLLTLKAINCSTGESLASTEADASDKNHVLDAMGKIASEVRGKLGESLASVQKYDVPPKEVSTPSLEALHSYSLAMKVRSGDFAKCIPLFQRALEQDPNFAMAYAQLGAVYINIGETVRGVDNLRKAYELRDHVSELEKFYIATHYDLMVTGDVAAARKDAELWAQIYPRDPGSSATLALIYYYLGDFEKLLPTNQESSALSWTKNNPHNVNPNTVWCFVFLNRLDEARSMALEAQTIKIDDPYYHLILYLIDFLRRDFAGMKQEAAGLAGNSTWGDAVFYYEAATAAYFGHFVQAREFTRRAADVAEKADKKQSAAIYIADAAIREALVGNSASAREQANSALAISRGKEVEAMAAIALSLAGDSEKATQLANDLDKRFPQDTIVQDNHLPTIRSAVELRGGNAAKAIQTLAVAAPYELGITALDAGTSLYPVYMRGEAYLAAKQGSAATAEFQKIIDHPGVVQNELIGALAHLGLGRAYALAGDAGKARLEYQSFLSLWKDADPDIPILKKARVEYAKLQ
jgi:eukaryotic-like serine/threonine-protein kinase